MKNYISFMAFVQSLILIILHSWNGRELEREDESVVYIKFIGNVEGDKPSLYELSIVFCPFHLIRSYLRVKMSRMCEFI
jgi:hypothetical protein